MLAKAAYYPVDETVLVPRLVTVVAELVRLHDEYRLVLVGHQEQYNQAYRASGESSDASRRREADFIAFSAWTAVEEVKAEMSQLVEERDLIRLLLRA